MPTLNSGPIWDRNNDGVIDGTSITIGEAELAVGVVGGIIIGIAQPEIGILELIGLAGGLAGDLATMYSMLFPSSEPNIMEALDAIKTNAARLVPSTGSVAQKLDLIDDHVTAIEPGSGGGLTTDEHNTLVGIPTTLVGIGEYVWNWPTLAKWPAGTATHIDAGGALEAAMYGALWVAQFTGYPIPNRHYWNVCTYDTPYLFDWYAMWTDSHPNVSLPQISLVGTVQPGDDVMTFLEREYPGYVYTTQGPSGWGSGNGVWIVPSSTPRTFAYRCTLTDGDLKAASAASIVESTGVQTLAPPVWPGDSLVTLHTSHALADDLVIDGPMHGLIVTITGHPVGAGKYAFGSTTSWQHAGAVVFQDDGGHFERAESFGLDSQIITPKTMAEAASATVRLNGGWSGTVRGWSITP